jgi:hypothetical protein
MTRRIRAGQITNAAHGHHRYCVDLRLDLHAIWLLLKVTEGAGEPVDPDPVVPTVGAN